MNILTDQRITDELEQLAYADGDIVPGLLFHEEGQRVIIDIVVEAQVLLLILFRAGVTGGRSCTFLAILRATAIPSRLSQCLHFNGWLSMVLLRGL